MQSENNKPEGINIPDLLEAGVHFGHLRSKWNPKDGPVYFHGEKRHPPY